MTFDDLRRAVNGQYTMDAVYNNLICLYKKEQTQVRTAPLIKFTNENLMAIEPFGEPNADTGYPGFGLTYKPNYSPPSGQTEQKFVVWFTAKDWWHPRPAANPAPGGQIIVPPSANATEELIKARIAAIEGEANARIALAEELANARIKAAEESAAMQISSLTDQNKLLESMADRFRKEMEHTRLICEQEVGRMEDALRIERGNLAELREQKNQSDMALAEAKVANERLALELHRLTSEADVDNDESKKKRQRTDDVDEDGTTHGNIVANVFDNIANAVAKAVNTLI